MIKFLHILFLLVVGGSLFAQTQIPSENPTSCINVNVTGAADGNGMFDIVNQNGEWKVTLANLSGNTSIRGVNESFELLNTATNGTHNISIGLGNSANQLRSRNTSTNTYGLVTTQVTQAVLSAGTNVTNFSRVTASTGEAHIKSGVSTANEVGIILDGVNGHIYTTGLTTVTGATSADADTAAGVAGVPATRLYLWTETGGGTYLMVKN